MLMITLAISCLTTSNLPWLMDLTFQVPMQYCSLQHQTLLLSPVTSTTRCCFYFGCIPSFFLELFLPSSPVAYWILNDLGSSSFTVVSFCLFILFMGFSRQEYWSGFPFPSPGTTFCQTSPLWPVHLWWPHMAWLSFIELLRLLLIFSSSRALRVAQREGSTTLVIIFLLLLVTKSHLTLRNPMKCDQPISSVHGNCQAKILECVAISFLRGFSWPSTWTHVSCLAGKFWATWEALISILLTRKLKLECTVCSGSHSYKWESLSCNPGHQAPGSTHGERQEVPGLEAEWAHQLSLSTENLVATTEMANIYWPLTMC